MKKNFFSIYGLLLAVCVVFTFSSCDNAINDIKSNVATFKADKFEENIKKAMDNNVVGYQYCISQDGKLVAQGANGWAIKPSAAAGGVPQSANKPQHVASVSKTITAIAAMKCLHDKGIEVDAPMYQYLPTSWEVGPAGTENITFKNLLTHTSGFTGVGSGYMDLKNKIASGVTYNEVGDYDYENANFGMFRILIPWITQHAYLETIMNDDALMKTETRRIFIEYLNNNVFKPAGVIGNAEDFFKPESASPTLYYDFLNPEDGSWANEEYQGLGGYGLFISAHNLCAIMAHFKHAETYFPASTREKMLNENLGFRNENGAKGTYKGHGGDWYTSTNGRGLRAAVLTFPNGVEAALLINCRDGNHVYQTTVLQKAFDEAWGL